MRRWAVYLTKNSHTPLMHSAAGGAGQGIGPSLQLEQYISAEFERFDSSESVAPYKTETYEQRSHRLSGAIVTHSALLAQPARYFCRNESRCARYACCPLWHCASASSTQVGQQLPERVSACEPTAHPIVTQAGQPAPAPPEPTPPTPTLPANALPDPALLAPASDAGDPPEPGSSGWGAG